MKSLPSETHKTNLKEENYWANFYNKVQHTSPSTFAQFVLNRKDVPHFIIDIGCGSGRDSFSFAKNSRYVVGIDRSHEAIFHATQYAKKQKLDDFIEFLRVDITESIQLKDALKYIKSKANSNNSSVMFYMRFFLHSITDKAQENLLNTIQEIATKNDFLAVEFRTDKDKETEKTYGDHYRRYQNAQIFSSILQNKYNFEVLFEIEEKDLSPYKDENPILYRAIAKKLPALQVNWNQK